MATPAENGAELWPLAPDSCFMLIRLLLFGRLKDLAGRERDSLELPEQATVADLLECYAARAPRLREYVPLMAVAVNQEYAGRDARLNDADEVALIPPVSGGCGGDSPVATAALSRARLTRDVIDTAALAQSLKQAEDGAVAIFEGIVRNHSRGRATLYLDYEAYEPMALKELERLASEALARFPVRDLRIAHRLGRLQIGETSVAIVVASAHRGAAFDACRWLIDTLKRTVPIWKKEHFSDGAVWADGEPFPEAIRRT